MGELKIERLPGVLSHPPEGLPEKTKNNEFTTTALEALAGKLYLWLDEPGAELPRMPRAFREKYGRAFDPEDYLERLTPVLAALYPARELLFRAEPERCFATCCTGVKVNFKGPEERVYWKRELTRTEEGVWLDGYRGPLEQDGWADDPDREGYERDLALLTAYVFAQAAREAKYPSLLFYTASGWPLAVRVR